MGCTQDVLSLHYEPFFIGMTELRGRTVYAAPRMTYPSSPKYGCRTIFPLASWLGLQIKTVQGSQGFVIIRLRCWV